MKCLWTILLLLAMVLLPTTPLFAQLLLQETFNTPTTDITTLPGWTLANPRRAAIAPP